MAKIKIQDSNMHDSDFNSLEWHDAVIKSILIDRSDPGIIDAIELLIHWPSGHSNKVIFKDVYMAILNLNFGVVAEESILDASLIEEQTSTIQALKNKWRKLYSGIEAVQCYEIKTSSTNSEIRIFAMSFEVK
jgi:hypothetical protein